MKTCDNGCVLFQIEIALDLSDEIDPVWSKRMRRSFWSQWAWSSSVLVCAEQSTLAPGSTDGHG